MPLKKKRNIKILHILLGNEFGGATVVVRLLCQYQLSQGYDVSVLTNDIPRSTEEFIKNNIPLVNGKGIKGKLSFPHDLFHLFYLAWFIRKNRFDIVHTQAVKAGIIGRLSAKFAGTKHIIHSGHGYGFEEKYKNSPILKGLYLGVERLLERITSITITQSQGNYDTALEYIAPKEKLRLVYNGIETSNYTKEDSPACRKKFRDEIGVSDDEFVVGTIGRLHEAKGHKYLIKAVSLLLKEADYKIKFVFVGDGPEEEDIKARVNKSGFKDNFIFLNHRDDIPNVMHGIDIHVLPSLREGFSISLLEAMAGKNPCIVTDIGGPGEAIEDGISGFIVPPKDPRSLKEAIEKLLKDKTLLHKMGENAASRVFSEFTSEVMGEKISEIYDSCLG